jgi:hypothetical protein
MLIKEVKEVYDELIEVYCKTVERGLTRQAGYDAASAVLWQLVSWSDDPKIRLANGGDADGDGAEVGRKWEAAAPAVLRWRERSMTCPPWQTNSSEVPVRVAARRRRLLVVLGVRRNSFAVPATSKSWARSIQIVIAGSVKLSGCGSRSRYPIAPARYASSGVREG